MAEPSQQQTEDRRSPGASTNGDERQQQDRARKSSASCRSNTVNC